MDKRFGYRTQKLCDQITKLWLWSRTRGNKLVILGFRL